MKKRYYITAALLLLFVIIQFRNPNIATPYKGIAGNLLNPIIYVVNRTGVFIRDTWQNYIWLVGVSKENAGLKTQLDELTLENAVLSERLVEFEGLDALLNFRDTYAFTTVAANVIGRNTDGYVKYVIIDRGSADGVKADDPVVSYSGLVGKVTQVYGGTSVVRLLFHHESSVSITNRRTRAVGVLKGDGNGGLYVDYYDRLDDVQMGDVFITSGMGQLFPKGIQAGTVTEISAPPTGLFQRVQLDCSVDFYKLEHVLVVQNESVLEEIPLP
jgi:rod shape-determining protein MreC